MAHVLCLGPLSATMSAQCSPDSHASLGQRPIRLPERIVPLAKPALMCERKTPRNWARNWGSRQSRREPA